MTDVLTSEQRRFNMSQIRGRNTKPELILRHGLHSRGLRFRIHRKDLPGTPDLVFPRYHAAIFVHGCFWHRHDCSRFKMPVTRRDFWAKKICANQSRDLSALGQLASMKWRTLVIWECALTGPEKLATDELLNEVVDWLGSQIETLVIPRPA
jgi:DNA mismatch endonuclease, patch repair protein